MDKPWWSSEGLQEGRVRGAVRWEGAAAASEKSRGDETEVRPAQVVNPSDPELGGGRQGTEGSGGATPAGTSAAGAAEGARGQETWAWGAASSGDSSVQACGQSGAAASEAVTWVTRLVPSVSSLSPH